MVGIIFVELETITDFFKNKIPDKVYRKIWNDWNKYQDPIHIEFEECSDDEYKKLGIPLGGVWILQKYHFVDYEEKWRYIHYNSSSGFSLVIGCNIQWGEEEEL